MAALPVSLAIAVVALPLALASIVALGGRVAVKARNILLVATLLAEVILAAIIGARATSEPFDLIYYHLRLPGGGVVALRLAGDWLTALLLVASALVQLAVGLFSIGYVRDARNANGYFGLLLVTGAAFNAATLANDLLTLLSAFVVLGFSFTLLIALDFSGPAASVAFRLLVTVGLTVGAGLAGLWTLVTTTGSTRLVDVTPSLIQAADSRWLLVSVAVGLAPAAWAGLVPLQSTITGTSRLALPTVGALLAGLAIAVGVTTLLRLFGPPADPAWGMWLASLGVVSIAIGGLGAVHLRDVLHQLGFIALMQSGLAIIPLGIGGQLGMALAAGQTLQLSLAIPLLYLAVGACRGLDGRVVFRQACVERPLAAVALLVAAFTAAGLPSTSGYTMRWLVAGVLGQPGQATRDPGLAPALWLIAILFSAMATGLFAGRLIWQPTTPNPRRLTPDPWHSTAQRGGAKAPVLPWAMAIPLAVLTAVVGVVGIASATIWRLAVAPAFRVDATGFLASGLASGAPSLFDELAAGAITALTLILALAVAGALRALELGIAPVAAERTAIRLTVTLSPLIWFADRLCRVAESGWLDLTRIAGVLLLGLAHATAIFLDHTLGRLGRAT